MKQSFYILAVFFLLFSACKKDNITRTNGEITGSWRLAEVYDKNTRTTSYPPAGSGSDVVIHFSNGNYFSGHTLRNTFDGGSYTISDNKIIFDSYSTTKVMEDGWGGSFYTVLGACYLQSVSPCSPSDFSVQDNILKIETSLRYNITLKKL